MSGRRRRELTDSFRLLATDERWFVTDLLVGVVAFAVWVAGTALLATRAAPVLGFSLDLTTGESLSLAAVALFGALWVVVPAVAVVVRLRQRTVNLRGNVEQYYRVDHPGTLLAPPALLAFLAVGAVVALGSLPWYLALALVPVGLSLLVRTLAFSYRVYAFSRPLVVQALLLLSTAAAIAGAFAVVGAAFGRRSLVEQVVRTVGLPAWIAGDVALAWVTVPGYGLGLFVSFAVAAAYVLVQSLGALLVHLRKPDVDRSRMRTGQRYPPFLETATPVQGPGGASTASTQSTASVDASDAAADGSAAASTDDSDGSDESEKAEESEDLDDVSHTRVFTPPTDDGGSDLGSTGSSDSSDGMEATETTTGSVADESDQGRCPACGESFDVDATVRYCPGCGTQLGE